MEKIAEGFPVKYAFLQAKQGCLLPALAMPAHASMIAAGYSPMTA
jgi:hypothetical protein